jgi:hypothetical protein
VADPRHISTEGIYIVDATPIRRISTDGVYIVHGPNQRRVSTDGIYVVVPDEPAPEPILPDAPTVEVVEIGARSAVFRMSPFASQDSAALHTATRARVRRADTLAVVWESGEITAPADLLEVDTGPDALPTGTALLVDAQHRDDSGRWSGWGAATPFETLYRPPVPPPEWVLPLPGQTFFGAVPLLLDAPTEARDGWTYRFEVTANNGATWTPVQYDVPEPEWTADILRYATGTTLRFRAAAHDGEEQSAWVLSESVTVGQDTRPWIERVEVIEPGAVRLHAGAYTGDGPHEATRWEVQVAGGDWSALVYDSGWGAAHLLASDLITGLDPIGYEARVTMRGTPETDPSEPFYFLPSLHIRTFAEAEPLSGWTGDVSRYAVIERDDAVGGHVLQDLPATGRRTILWTEHGPVNGFRARLSTANRWTVGEQPYVIGAALGWDLQLLVNWDAAHERGYRIYFRTWSGEIIITRVVYGVEWAWTIAPRARFQFAADRSYEVEVRTYSRRIQFSGFNVNWRPGDGFANMIAGYDYLCPVVEVWIDGAKVLGYTDTGWQAVGVAPGRGGSIMPSALSHSGHVGIHTAGPHGARAIDWVAISGRGTAAPRPIEGPSPQILAPYTGQVIDHTLHLELYGHSDEYEWEVDHGEGWTPLSPLAPETEREIDTTAWPSGTDYRLRARGVTDGIATAWAVLEPLIVDQGIPAKLSHSLDLTAPVDTVPASLSPIWDTTQPWAIGSQSDGTVRPPQILRLRNGAPGLSFTPTAGLAYTPLGQIRHGHILAEVRNFSDFGHAGVLLQASGTLQAGDWEGYAVLLKRGNGEIIARKDGRTRTLYRGPLLAVRTGVPWLVEVQRTGTIIQARAWQHGTPRPEAWTVQVIDGLIDAPGWWGIAAGGSMFDGWTRGVRSLSVTNFEAAPPIPDDYEPAPPSRPCTLALICYAEDQRTPIWQVTTDPADRALSLLCEPEHYGEQEVDFAAGRASIGQVNVTVIDPATTPGDQDSGWMTERLAGPDGITAVAGRRQRLLRWIDEEQGWVTIIDGPAGAPRLDSSWAAYSWEIRDTREQERRHRAFSAGATSTAFPGGVLEGYGRRPDGTWLVPPTRPIVGTVREATLGFFRLSVDFAEHWSGARVASIATITAAAEAAMQPQGATWAEFHWPLLAVMWRRAGSADPWTVVHPVGAPQWLGETEYINTLALCADGQLADGTAVRGVRSLYLRGLFSPDPLPSHGDRVEIIVRYLGPPSKDFPFHFEGTAGELLRRLYDGEYSDRGPMGELVPIGVRYDPEALAAMTERVRVRFAEPVKDAREWAEKYIYAPLGYAPALDSQGRVSPVHQARVREVHDITDAHAEPVPGWQHGDKVVNLLRFIYFRDYADPASPDGVGIQEVTLEFPNIESITKFGERPLELRGDAFRAIDGASGDSGDYAQRLAAARWATIGPRYGHGAPGIVTVPVMRRQIPTARVGDWCRLSLSWMPDYPTQRRGLQERTGQIIAIRDLDCAWREITAELAPLPGPEPDPDPEPEDLPRVEVTSSFPGESGGTYEVEIEVTKIAPTGSVVIHYEYAAESGEYDIPVRYTLDLALDWIKTRLLDETGETLQLPRGRAISSIIIVPHADPGGAGQAGPVVSTHPGEYP